MKLTELLDIMSHDINSLTMSEKLMGCAVVTVLAMMIVFAVLVLISFVVSTMQKVLVEKKPEPVKVVPAAESAPAPVVEEENNDEEIVAAISSAIAASIGTSPSKIVVRKIERVSDAGTAWSRAAINEQMQ